MSGCKLHNIVFHHGSLLPHKIHEIHGNMNWTDGNSLRMNDSRALSLKIQGVFDLRLLGIHM